MVTIKTPPPKTKLLFSCLSLLVINRLEGLQTLKCLLSAAKVCNKVRYHPVLTTPTGMKCFGRIVMAHMKNNTFTCPLHLLQYAYWFVRISPLTASDPHWPHTPGGQGQVSKKKQCSVLIVAQHLVHLTVKETLLSRTHTSLCSRASTLLTDPLQPVRAGNGTPGTRMISIGFPEVCVLNLLLCTFLWLRGFSEQQQYQ